MEIDGRPFLESFMVTRHDEKVSGRKEFIGRRDLNGTRTNFNFADDGSGKIVTRGTIL